MKRKGNQINQIFFAPIVPNKRTSSVLNKFIEDKSRWELRKKLNEFQKKKFHKFGCKNVIKPDFYILSV